MNVSNTPITSKATTLSPAVKGIKKDNLIFSYLEIINSVIEKHKDNLAQIEIEKS